MTYNSLQIKDKLTTCRMEQLRRAASKSMLGFTLYTKRNYYVNWHHNVLCGNLDKFVKGEIKRLMIFMPPQTGKSELASRRLPAYVLGKNPNEHIIACSHTDDFAQRLSRDVQRIIDTDEYLSIFPNTTLFGRNIKTSSFGSYIRTSRMFEIVNYNGSYKCAGVGGSIIGNPGTTLILDDPYKDYEEAASETIREKVWDWYTTVFYSRRSSEDAKIMIIQTRWHEDDLCGRLLEQQPEKWHVISFPAICEEPIHPEDLRKIGDPLWPARFSLQDLNDTKLQDGSYKWSALYQQRPSPAGGAIFKRKYFQYYSKNHEFFHLQNIDGGESTCLIEDCKVFAVMDLATSMKETADYTVALVFAVTPEKKILILDVVRERFEAADHEGLVKQVYNLWKPIVIGIESTQYQISLVQKMIRKSFPVKAIKPDKDKVTRSLPMQARMEAGSVYFKMNASWLDCFENELLSFPNGKHDDQVDAFAYTSEMIAPYFINLPEYKINSDRKRFSLNLNGY